MSADALDLPYVLDAAWALLSHGAAERASPCHTPVVANVDRNGAPQQRVMVLREADRASRLLRFHTDARSPKAQDIGDSARLSVLAYHPVEKTQLRITGQGRIEHRGGAAQAAWEASTLFARRCYLAEAAPGSQAAGPVSGLPAWAESARPTEEQIAPARASFSVLLVEAQRIDWLYLAHSGHRRAAFDFYEDAWHGRWLIP